MSQSLEGCPLPKQVIGVWQIVDVIGQISRKLVELDVVVSEQHRLAALAAHVVPLAARIGDHTVGVPGPIALNDLRGRLAGEFRPFNPFIALYELACAAGNLRNSE